MLNNNVALHHLPDEDGTEAVFAKCQLCNDKEKILLPIFVKNAIEQLYKFYKSHEHCHR